MTVRLGIQTRKNEVSTCQSKQIHQPKATKSEFSGKISFPNPIQFEKTLIRFKTVKSSSFDATMPLPILNLYTSYSCMGAPFGKLLRRARASNSGNCSTSVSISPNWISTWTDTRAPTKPIPCINRGRDNRLPPHDFVLYFLVFFIFVSC